MSIIRRSYLLADQPLPLTLDGVVAWWDPTALDTMSQNAAGTTEVTSDGDPVHRWTDRVGGVVLQAPSGSERPVLDITGGKYALRGDGIDSTMVTTTGPFDFTSGFGAMMGIQIDTDATGGLGLLSTNSSTGTGAAVMEAVHVSSRSLRANTNRASTVAVLNGTMTAAFGAPFIYEAWLTGADTGEILEDGTVIKDIKAGTGSLIPAGTTNYWRIMEDVFSGHLDGLISDVVLIDPTVMSASDRTALRDWIAARWTS